jgi:hypothetical protein
MFRKAVQAAAIVEIALGAAWSIRVIAKSAQVTEGALLIEPVSYQAVSGPMALIVGGLIAYALAWLSARIGRAPGMAAASSVNSFGPPAGNSPT